MRLHLFPVVLLLVWISCLRAESFVPATTTAAGQRAFDDLARLYRDESGPDLPALWQQLHASDAATRQLAGAYLLALCQQTFDDEITGRTTSSRFPPAFGQRSPMYAREFRKRLAKELPDHAAVAECLPAIRWFFDHDVLADAQVSAALTLRKIHDPAADALLLALLSPPHRNGVVLTAALEELVARKLQVAADTLRPLTVHYRADVRRAALTAASALGIADLPAYSPEAALTAGFDPVLRRIATMVLTPIPFDARFVAATIQYPARDGRAAHADTAHGWLLSESAEMYHLLGEYAEEVDLPKARTTIAFEPLADRARELRDLRDQEAQSAKRRFEGTGAMSRSGSLSGQFEPPQVRLPEILVGVWAYQRGDATSAALVLLPRLEDLADERWFEEIARDLLGHYYHQQMLTRYADYWDYPGALRLAKHLNSSLFEGYEFQYRARELMVQLPKRADEDFHALLLPTPAEWHRLCRQLTRNLQITFLADRLHLISVRQFSWPGRVNLLGEQRSLPRNTGIYGEADAGRGEEVINPYFELRAMTLAPTDVPALIPYLGDEEYLRTYYCWRPWHPGWEVFQVNGLVAGLINDAVGGALVDLRDYYATPPSDLPQYLSGLTERATRQYHPRLLRALLDTKALLKAPADPILGLLGFALAGLWYRRRHAARGIAWLAVAVFLSAGVISLWYPALQDQRVLLHADAFPPLLAVVLGSVLLRYRLDGSSRRGLLLAAVALAAAWLAGRYFYLDSLINPFQLAAVVLLLWPMIRLLQRSRRGWAWLVLAVFFAAAALANSLWIEVMFLRRYHIRLSPDFEPPFLLSHPVWTTAVLLACFCLLQCIWRQCVAQAVPAPAQDSQKTS